MQYYYLVYGYYVTSIFRDVLSLKLIGFKVNNMEVPSGIE